MCTFSSSFPVLTATVTKPNIWSKTNPNVLLSEGISCQEKLRLRPDQPFLVKVHLSSVPSNTPFPQTQNLFLETAKLPP